MWGNVKVPYYSKIEATGAAKNDDGWIRMPANFTPIYSSLFGIPISSLRIGNTTFNIESTYTELSCGEMNVTSQPVTGDKSDLISVDGPFVSFQNVTLNAAWAVGYQGPDLTTPMGDSDSAWVLPKSCPDVCNLSPSFPTLKSYSFRASSSLTALGSDSKAKYILICYSVYQLI